MATSSISADVKAANSKLAEFLRRQDEEEMILQIGKRKPKQAAQERLPGGSGRWKLEPDWKAPTPMVDRPRTTAGSTSFHFSYISIAKSAVPTLGGDPVSGNFGKARNAALEHSKYIERDGAAEHSRGADHAGYIERDGAAEMLDPSALMREGIESTITSVINETPTSEEAELLGLVDVVPEGIPSVFSNISDDPFERQEFWRAVERMEATPRSHQIIMEPDIAPAWWREVATTNRLEPKFQNHALQVAEAYRQHMAKPVPEGEERPAFVPLPMSVTAEEAGRFIDQAQRMANYNDAYPPFEFNSGRGGRIQFRMVAELPHELTAEDRALIVQNFCDHLASLEERRDENLELKKTGMMYTAVIHAPDAHNDSRNYHLHVVAYDRPCRFLPEHGQWDFEVPVVYVDPGSRKERTHYPYRQNKIGEVTQGSSKTGKEKSGKDFIPGLRAKFAEINNLVLRARGVKRQLDPRKYTEMGIDRTPTEHLGTKAAALESIGVPTAVGKLNAIAIWSDAERAIRRQAVQTGKALQAAQGELETIAEGMTAYDPTHPVLSDLRRLMAERERLIRDVAEDREGIMTFDHMEAKAKSRAIRTRQTCLQFLADIEAGRADRNTKSMRLVIQDRWKGAQAHINSIDAALAPHREALAKAARNIEAREQRIREIDTQLEPIRAVLEKRLAGQVQLPTSSKDKRSKGAQQPAAAEPVVATPEAAPAQPQAEATNTPAPTTAEATGITGQPAPSEQAAAPAVAEPETSQPIEPMSIEGLPIVQPTIAPIPSGTDEEAEVQPGTPEGLEPLRPAEVQEPVAGEPEVIISDLDTPLVDPVLSPAAAQQPAEAGATESPPVEGKAPVVTTGAEPAASEPVAAPTEVSPKGSEDISATATQEPAEPKVDRRKKPVDPVLFDLPPQEPPVKPGTSKAAYADFDNLIKKVKDERIPVSSEKQANGTLKFLVPSLTREQQELLEKPRFAHRTNQRLEAIMDKQKQEVQRVIRWISTQGQNPHNLRLENRTASLGAGVKDSVRNLFRHWRGHGDVTAALLAEYERRVELAKAEEKAVADTRPQTTETDQEFEERKKEAERVYPEPSQIVSPVVKEFSRLLREVAPDAELRAAADKVHADPHAREEVNKHTVYLATAYRNHSEGFDQRLAQQRMRDASSKGR